MNELLQKYIGENIGINFKNVKRYDYAKLIKVEKDYFAVEDSRSRITYSYSYTSILNIIEADGGLSSGSFFDKRKYPVCIEVYHLLVYSGAMGIGVSF